MKAREYFSRSLAPVIAAALVLAPDAQINAQQAQTPNVIVVPRTPDLSYSANEVLKMVKAGVDDDVIRAFIDGYEIEFDLSADDILYLDQQGVDPELISAMLRHDSNLANQKEQQQAAPAQGSQDQGQTAPPSSSSQYNSSSTQAPASTYLENPPPEVATFYQSLSPYGSWIYLNGRGWCWQPSIAQTDTSWQPYVDGGNWLYTSDGWYWDSAYPWGWAPYHYGRWWNAPCGWVWFPDTVWAPSWVNWRYYGGYCGWAAIPPAPFPVYGLGYGRHFGFGFEVGFGSPYCFVRFGDMFSHDLRFHRFHGSHDFFRHTVPVNGFHHFDGRVQNFGVPVNHAAHMAGRPISTVPVNPRGVDPRVVTPGVFRNGHQSAVVRPALPDPPSHTSGMIARQVPANAGSVHGPTTLRSGVPAPAFMRSQSGTASRAQIGELSTAHRNFGASSHVRSFNAPAMNSTIAPNTFNAPHSVAPRNFSAPRSVSPAPRSFTAPRTFAPAPSMSPRASAPAPAFLRSAPAPAFRSSAPSFHSTAPSFSAPRSMPGGNVGGGGHPGGSFGAGGHPGGFSGHGGAPGGGRR